MRLHSNSLFIQGSILFHNNKTSLVKFIWPLIGLFFLFSCIYFLGSESEEDVTLPPFPHNTDSGPLTIQTSLINYPCRRNTGVLVQHMRDTQRQTYNFLRHSNVDPLKQWELVSSMIKSAMTGFRYILKPNKYNFHKRPNYFVDFSDPNAECNHVIFGVGDTWEGDKALRQKYPQCRVFAVDEVEEPSKRLVDAHPNSMFLQVKVSNVSAGPYQRRTSYTMPDLLMLHNEGRVVDIFSIDLDGVEYEILDNLNKKRLELPVICQVNARIYHGMHQFQTSPEQLELIMFKMMHDSHFIVLDIDEKKDNMQDVFLFNIEDDECIVKYLC